MMAFLPVSPLSDDCHCEHFAFWLGRPERSAADLCFTWRRPSHADPIGESPTRGGDWDIAEAASVSAEEAPLARALRCGRLVATLNARLRLIRNYEEGLQPIRATDTRSVADRRTYRDLLIMLATEILRRERGA